MRSKPPPETKTPGRPCVVHVVLSLDCGGLERVVLDLIREGQSLGQRVAVACLERPGELAAEVQRLGATVACAYKGPGVQLGAVGRMGRLLRGLGPDIVHTHQVGALLYAGPIGRQAGASAVVHTEHGKHYDGSSRRRLLGRIAGRYAARFFCVSEDIAAAVVAHRVVSRRKVGVVRNGIDVARFAARGDAAEVRGSLGIPPGAPVVGTVGRLNEVKRQDRLIRAFARVLRDAPDAHLLLVGDGPLREELGRMAEGLGLGRRAHFVGYQGEPERFLGAMDAFALTSRSEGMPLAILEAWATGLPVVASRVGGVPELVDDGRNGLLFDPDDRGEAALAAALRGLLTDPDLSRRLGEAGRRLVASAYSLRGMAGAYDSHYRKLLEAGAVGRVAAPDPSTEDVWNSRPS